MRLAMVQLGDEPSPAVVVDEPGGGLGVVLLRTLMGASSPASVLDAVPLRETIFARLRDRPAPDVLVPAGGPGCTPGRDFRWLPPVPRPPTFRDFYAFEAHVRTARARRGLPMDDAWYERPVFYFSSTSSLVGHEAAVYAPAGSRELDYELEVGILIGRGGRDIPLEHAWEHVAGLTILNDFSARDLQRQEMKVGLGPCKGKDFATAVGPWLVPLDRFDIDDNGRIDAAMTARVNGRTLSRGNLAELHFTIPRLIAEASRDCTLLPGDLLGTGTVGTGCILELGPETVGGYLRPGDVVELEVQGIGILRNIIVERPASAAVPHDAPSAATSPPSNL